MTLPAIIGHYKKQEIASKLKKFSSTIQNAFTMASAQYGDMSSWDYPNKQNDAEQTNEFVSTYLYPFLTGLKECKAGDKTCKKLIELINGEDGTAASYSISTAYVFMDGSCFSILTGGTGPNALMMHITYDYNCEKKPNKYDKDVFSFIIRVNRTTIHTNSKPVLLTHITLPNVKIYWKLVKSMNNTTTKAAVLL